MNNLSGVQYSVNKSLRFKTPMVGSDLSEHSDTYIVVKETITVEDTNTNNRTDKMLAFKNNASFRSMYIKNQ